MALTIIKPSKYVKEKLLRKAAKEVFSYLGDEFEVNVKFACENCIRNLNKEYQGIDAPTNVLSFNHDVSQKDGDIVICESVVEKESEKLGVKVPELDLLYLVHGMLHLAGFEHTKTEDRDKMEKTEEIILSKIGVEIER